MISYAYLGTNNLTRATRFYDATLAPLEMPRCIAGDPEWDRISAGWGLYEDGGAQELAFWIGTPFDHFYAAYVRDPDGNKTAESHRVCAGRAVVIGVH